MKLHCTLYKLKFVFVQAISKNVRSNASKSIYPNTNWSLFEIFRSSVCDATISKDFTKNIGQFTCYTDCKGDALSRGGPTKVHVKCCCIFGEDKFHRRKWEWIWKSGHWLVGVPIVINNKPNVVTRLQIIIIKSLFSFRLDQSHTSSCTYKSCYRVM